MLAGGLGHILRVWGRSVRLITARPDAIRAPTVGHGCGKLGCSCSCGREANQNGDGDVTRKGAPDTEVHPRSEERGEIKTRLLLGLARVKKPSRAPHATRVTLKHVAIAVTIVATAAPTVQHARDE